MKRSRISLVLVGASLFTLVAPLPADEQGIAGVVKTDWFYQAPEHRHWSGSGAPLVHAFRTEPAFNHRGLFLDYSFRTGDDGDEHELEAELEWALTDRLGVILELPFVFEESDEGFGDLAIVPRAVLVKRDRFLLTANLEIGLPTGDSDLGFGDEVSLAPSVSAWFDLGNWWTLSAQFGWERGLDSGSDELFGSAALIHTFGRADHEDHGHGHGPGDHHLEPGLLSVLLEVSAGLELESGGDEDLVAEGIVGFNYGVTEHLDVRLGYQLPLTNPREFDGGFILGLVHHF